MKHLLLLLSVLLLVAGSALAESDEKTTEEKVEPAEFKVMLRGYCYAGNKDDDPSAFGGYASSDNLPRSLPDEEAPKHKKLYLELDQTADAVFAEKYEGITLRLINGSGKKIAIPASDSRLSLVQQALDENEEWKDVEYLPSSWCGNSYHNVYLPPKNYYRFVGPRYSGPQKTKLRFELTISKDEVIYSETYDGGIHLEQFSVKQGHTSTDIMDPYDE